MLPVINIFEQPLSVTHVTSLISNALRLSNQGFTATIHSIIEDLFKNLPPLDRLYSALSGRANHQPSAALVLKIKTLSSHDLTLQRSGSFHPLNLGTLHIPPPSSFLDIKVNDLQARFLKLQIKQDELKACLGSEAIVIGGVTFESLL